MNTYYLELVKEYGGNIKRVVNAETQEEAIAKALNALSDREFDKVIKVNAEADKNNK